MGCVRGGTLIYLLVRTTVYTYYYHEEDEARRVVAQPPPHHEPHVLSGVNVMCVPHLPVGGVGPIGSQDATAAGKERKKNR